MASCYTWSNSASHIRHPWFDNSIAKRKHSSPPSSTSSSPSPESDAEDHDLPPPPTKRRRFSALENGIAHLSLNHIYPGITNLSGESAGPMPQVHEVFLDSQLPSNPLCTTFDVSMDPSDDQQPAWRDVVLPGSVEEPTIPEINMKSSSWYEPEPDRIVITDLDAYSDDEDDEHSNTAPNTISINPAYLERMRSQSYNSVDPSKLKPAPSQALVLFKPMPFSASPAEHDDTGRGQTTKISDEEQSSPPASTEDAMDVEP